MDTTRIPKIIEDDVVVTLDYQLKVDGENIDSSDDAGPVEFIQGRGNIISGLEKVLYGLKIGDKKVVIVAPVDGYGEVDPEAFMDVPRSELPDDIPMEVGVELEMQNEEDETIIAVIDTVTKDTVRLNFNHPLSGKELHFDIEVIGLRQPTEEELEHGHVHGDDLDEDDEYLYEDLEDDDEDYDDDDDEDSSES